MAGIPLLGKQIDYKSGVLVLLQGEAQSPVFQVTDKAYTLYAYGLPSGSSITLYSVSQTKIGIRESVFSHKGQKVILSPSNPTGLVGLSGSYRVKYTGPSGVVTCLAVPEKIGLDSKSHITRSLKSRPNTYSENFSSSPFSHIIEVQDIPWVIRLYGAVEQVIHIRQAIDETTHVRTGRTLNVDTCSDILDTTGRFLFELEGSSAGIVLTAEPNFINYFDPYGASIDWSTITTDSIPEGSNLYFTVERVLEVLGGQSSTGELLVADNVTPPSFLYDDTESEFIYGD